MRLGVYSLEKVLYQGEAREINVKTASGEITILDHHRPLITMLQAGPLKIVDQAGQEHFFDLHSGFAEVSSQNQVQLIVDEA